MKNRAKGIMSTLVILFLGAPPALADQDVGDAPAVLDSIVPKTGVTQTNIFVVLGNVLQAALTLVGSIFLIILIYGGFLWMTARGNEETITKAKSNIRGALIGIIIIVASFAIVRFLTTSLFPQ